MQLFYPHSCNMFRQMLCLHAFRQRENVSGMTIEFSRPDDLEKNRFAKISHFTLHSGPAAPKNLSVFNNHATQLSIRWDDVHTSIVSSYLVQYWVQSGPVQQTVSTSQLATITSLQTNTRYSIRVRSLTSDTNVTSADSQVIHGTTRKCLLLNSLQTQ